LIHCWESRRAIASDRGQQWFEVGRVVLSLREHLPPAAGLLDGRHDPDDLIDGDPPVVDPHQHPADDVVDRRPLDALEPFQVSPQRATGLRSVLRRRRRGDLDVYVPLPVPVVGPHPARVPRQRGLEHAAGDAGDAPDVPVGDRVRAGDQRADRPDAGLGGRLRELERAAGHRRRGVHGGTGETAGRPRGLGEQSRGQDGGCDGEPGAGRRQPRNRPGRAAGGRDPAEQSHRRPLETTVAGDGTPGGRTRPLVVSGPAAPAR
jgi:hypothetical protein